MKSIQEQIAVMTHFANDGKVEYYNKIEKGVWILVSNPSWNWDIYDYRIHQSPIAAGHNPDKLTEEQVQVVGGWRLLNTEEVKKRNLPPPNAIQLWLQADYSWDNRGQYQGNEPDNTYRTKLTPAELSTYNIQPKPLSAEDFPPGTVIRHKDWNKDTYTMVTFAGAEKIRYSTSENGRSEITYSSLVDSGYLRSTDGGKTWKPCHK